MSDHEREGLKKKRINDATTSYNGQSAAKQVGDDLKVQRLVGVISR